MDRLWTNWFRAAATAAFVTVTLAAVAQEQTAAPVPPTPAATPYETPILDAATQFVPADELPASPISYNWSPTPGGSSVPTAGPAPAPAAGVKKPAAPPAFPGPKTLPPTGPYKALFFQNDFSYKKDPKHDYVFGEELKDMQSELFGETLTISTGGEIRHRYMKEDNRLRPGGPIDADNQLWRWRHYVDAKYGDVRVYFEGIDAESFGNEAPDQAIDVNRWDIQNLFVDVLFHEGELGKHMLRYGRQELLFGRQRLVSPLDWANTRRNFEGFRYLLKGSDFTLDAFLVRPVNSATGFNSVAEFDNKFDTPNDRVDFAGTYYSYTGRKNTVLDLYWLYLDTQIEDPTRPDGQRHTLGSHWSYLYPITDGCGNELRVWDFDAEGGFQVGDDNREDVFAGFLTTIGGHTWKKAPWTPRLSGLFYYGSGDRAAGSGQNNTFDVLFPLGHAYWAISDNLAGQNLMDYSLQADVRPTKKTALTSAVHWFNLASDGDVLYNVAGAPVGTPGNGRDVGQALDLYGYYAFNPNFDIQAGYSWFWYGQYIDATAPRGDATQFYVQTSLRY
ncbi:MAG: alginate export family protein [Planctomycetaceae bacterium]|nr:alginate export family protein [Planctomycetaceae bacterium]